MPVLVVRLINSFDCGTVFYMPLPITDKSTLNSVKDDIMERVSVDTKYRPLRATIKKFNCFKVYCLPGQPKPANLVIAPEGQEFTVEDFSRPLTELNIHGDCELSFFNCGLYEQYKTGVSSASTSVKL